MRRQPIIGILGNVRRDPDPNFVCADRNYTNTACVRALDGNGGVPIILPVPEDPGLSDPALTLCDGLLFPGGWDVDPRHYGEPPPCDTGAGAAGAGCLLVPCGGLCVGVPRSHAT